MSELAKKGDDVEVPTLLSTHPAHGSRTENLLSMMPEVNHLTAIRETNVWVSSKSRRI